MKNVMGSFKAMANGINKYGKLISRLLLVLIIMFDAYLAGLIYGQPDLSFLTNAINDRFAFNNLLAAEPSHVPVFSPSPSPSPALTPIPSPVVIPSPELSPNPSATESAINTESATPSATLDASPSAAVSPSPSPAI